MIAYRLALIIIIIISNYLFWCLCNVALEALLHLSPGLQKPSQSKSKLQISNPFNYPSHCLLISFCVACLPYCYFKATLYPLFLTAFNTHLPIISSGQTAGLSSLTLKSCDLNMNRCSCCADTSICVCVCVRNVEWHH